MAFSERSRKIWVPMPESDMYRKSVSRERLVDKYGEATVSRAEVASILNILYATGQIRPSEFFDIMVRQCERVEDERRKQANLDEDRG
jgi:hypothetical protein